MKDDPVEPRVRRCHGPGEGQRRRGGAGGARRQAADDRVGIAVRHAVDQAIDGNGDRHVARSIGNGPTAQLHRVGTGCIQRARLGDIELGHGRVERRLRQQAVVRVVGECLGLDVADRGFERPVAAQARSTGRVGRRRDVGTGQAGHLQQQPVALLGHVASVQKDVAIGGQAGADGLPRRGMFVDVVCRDRAVAEGDFTGSAVAHDRQRVDVGATPQRVRQLRCAVGVRVDQDHIAALGQRADDLLPVGHVLVDHVHHMRCCIRRRFCGSQLG